MHELSLADALVRQAEEVLSAEKGNRILSLTVRLGALSGVDREAFEFAFPMVAGESAAENAVLVVEEVPAVLRCRDCGGETCPESFSLTCGRCGSDKTDIVSGREFELKTMEIE